ncbi:MAG: hypothetical protein M5R36_24215 [Deltaproteobacteria bacterium]|nr:hypothetical protein [Deltaproteobacteria bacterium]
MSWVNHPSEYFFYLIGLTLIIFAAAGLQSLVNMAPRRGRWAIPAALALGAFIAIAVKPSFFAGQNRFAQVHTRKVPSLPEPDEFFSIGNRFYETDDAHDVLLDKPEFFQWYRNRLGVIEYETKFLYRAAVRPRYQAEQRDGDWALVPNPDFRGMAYFESGEGDARLDLVFGNHMTVTGNARKPGTLVINQNYYDGWSAEGRPVVDAGGLIGVRIEKAGPFEVRLRFRSSAFRLGAAISILSFVLLAWFGVRSRRARRAPA